MLLLKGPSIPDLLCSEGKWTDKCLCMLLPCGFARTDEPLIVSSIEISDGKEEDPTGSDIQGD